MRGVTIETVESVRDVWRRYRDPPQSADRDQGGKENMAEKVLVVQGGKLIDGTGRPPG